LLFADLPHFYGEVSSCWSKGKGHLLLSHHEQRSP
jgi:hypothetical protein